MAYPMRNKNHYTNKWDYLSITSEWSALYAVNDIRWPHVYYTNNIWRYSV